MRKKKTSSASVWFIAVLCVLAAALAIYVVVSFLGSGTMFASSSFKKGISSYFGKSASAVTQEDLDQIKVLIIDDTSNNRIVFGGDDLYNAIETNFNISSEEEAVEYDDYLHEIDFATPVTTFADYKLFRNVKYVNVSDCSTFKSLADLENFKDLEYLYMNGRGIESLDGIENFPKIKSLFVDGNKIGDLGAVANLNSLKALSIADTGVSDLTPIKDKDLFTLIASNNEITDVSALSGMTGMKTLDLGYNKITDVSALSGMTELESIYLQKNEELESLHGLENAEKLVEIYAAQCSLNDISALANSTKLDTVYLSDNKIEDISALSGMNEMRYLSLSDNDVKSVAPLKDKTGLIYLLIDGNENVTDWEELDGLANTSISGRPEAKTEETTEPAETAEQPETAETAEQPETAEQ